jgi:hypothetical protein
MARAAAGAIYRSALCGRAVKCLVFCHVRGCRMPALLRRPGDRAIGCEIGLSALEFVAASVQLAIVVLGSRSRRLLEPVLTEGHFDFIDGRTRRLNFGYVL